MFRKYNGVSKRLYKEQNCLYLKADMTTFVFGNATEVGHGLTRNIEEDEPKTVILDMSSITTIDSTAIGVLIHVTAECKKKNCSVFMCNVIDAHVMQVLHMLLIEVFIPIIDVNKLLAVTITLE